MDSAQVAKNEFMRVGGFSPTQWVLGRLPRGVGHVLDEEELGQLGVLSGRLDATTAFGRQAEFRHTARKAFVHEDCSRRVRKTVLRKSAIQEPMAEDTSVDAGVEAETTEDSALLLRAYASHFWTKEEMTVWNPRRV